MDHDTTTALDALVMALRLQDTAIAALERDMLRLSRLVVEVSKVMTRLSMQVQKLEIRL